MSCTPGEIASLSLVKFQFFNGIKVVRCDIFQGKKSRLDVLLHRYLWHVGLLHLKEISFLLCLLALVKHLHGNGLI